MWELSPPTSYPRLGTVGWWVHSEDMEGRLNVPETPWKEEFTGRWWGHLERALVEQGLGLWGQYYQ